MHITSKGCHNIENEHYANAKRLPWVNTINLNMSFLPNYVLLAVFIVYLFFQYKAFYSREHSLKNKLKILMIKNYEMKTNDDDDEDDEGAAGMNRIG